MSQNILKIPDFFLKKGVDFVFQNLYYYIQKPVAKVS